MTLKLNGASSGHVTLDAKASAASNTLTLPSTANGELVAADSSGNITISNGNLIVGTAGKGIDFSATSGTGTSELLADYEEGTYTPTWTGITNNGSYNSWKYMKIGKMVTIWGTFVCSATTNDTTQIVVSLPFAQIANHTNGLAQTVGSIVTYNINWNKDNVIPICQTAISGFKILEYSDNGGWDYLKSSEVSVSDQMVVTISYQAGA